MATLPRTEHAVARRLASTADPRVALRRALGEIGESLGWPFGAVWETPPDRIEALRCTEVWHDGGPGRAEFEAHSRATTFAAGEGLPGRAWLTGTPTWIADVMEDDNFPRAEMASRAGLLCAIAFPIRSARGMLGVIEFFAPETRRIDEDLLATVATLGDQIGQAIERRRDAEALRAKEARHVAMLHGALDAVVTIDTRGCIVDFNAAAERSFGYTADEAIGQEMCELIVPPDFRDLHRRGFARYLETEEAHVLDRRLELSAMRSSGVVFPVELTITRIDVPGPPMFTAYLRDITDRKAAEAELRASRARIVAAADSARRKIERDLHDGAQQRLVEMALDLRMAEGSLGDGDSETRELIQTAIGDLRDAISELRELARGIHPAALSEGGLRPALEGLVNRCKVPTKLIGVPEKRYPESVEVTAYFVVAEALTNVAKYAEAAHVDVEVRCNETSVEVIVADDGKGGADPANGSGLRGLGDRLVALDGRLHVTSHPGEGTTLRAEIPCEW